MASSTYGTYLMHKGTGDTYSKLIDIKDFGDLGGDPELLETTTLSDAMQTYVEGIQSAEALPFTANYTKEDYDKLVALKGKKEAYAVYFGVDGADGMFKFDGYLSVKVNGGGVNEVRNMTISIAPASEIKNS